jgi:hypothetical protein
LSFSSEETTADFVGSTERSFSFLPTKAKGSGKGEDGELLLAFEEEEEEVDDEEGTEGTELDDNDEEEELDDVGAAEEEDDDDEKFLEGSKTEAMVMVGEGPLLGLEGFFLPEGTVRPAEEPVRLMTEELSEKVVECNEDALRSFLRVGSSVFSTLTLISVI